MFGVLEWNGDNLRREQLGKQSMGTHRNPEMDSRQFHQISQEREGLCMYLGWLADLFITNIACVYIKGQPNNSSSWP